MLRDGYLDEAMPAELLDAAWRSFARIIASNAQIAVRGMKSRATKFDEAAATARACTATKCGKAASFAEKRPPRFSGAAHCCRITAAFGRGNWNSCDHGTPYGITHTDFATVSRNAATCV
jgi:hypothetical protein